ncbi:hypothetical protein [Cellulomonas massiliensis]|uniref:hypothetical protein n=1 Tax=Cellulomonas massiliensis TaxID=1465811 RepID=UPI0011C9A867|nr:hypothetical protein [Cellulomonas massiliensis]
MSAVLTGCSTAPGAGDLIKEDPGEGCFPQTAGKPVQINMTVIRNTHDVAANIESVRLEDSQGIRLEDALLLPLEQWSEVVVGDVFDADDPAWVGAERAEGASVGAGQNLGLVLVVSADATGGTSKPVEVEYTLDGRRYEARSSNDLKIVPVGSVCGG